MNNFIFENKTKVYFGKRCVGEYLPKIAAMHGDKVLFAYGGGSIKKNGVYEEVIAALEKAGKTIIEFPGIMENPTYKKVLEGTKLVKEKQNSFDAYYKQRCHWSPHRTEKPGWCQQPISCYGSLSGMWTGRNL